MTSAPTAAVVENLAAKTNEIVRRRQERAKARNADGGSTAAKATGSTREARESAAARAKSRTPDFPSEEECRVAIVQTRARLAAIVDAASSALGRVTDGAGGDLLQAPIAPIPVACEALVVDTSRITVDTLIDGKPRRENVQWGFVTRLSIPRPAFVEVHLSNAVAPDPELLTEARKHELLRQLEGVIGATVACEAQEAREQVEDWLREGGVILLDAEQACGQANHIASHFALAFLRGSVLYLGTLATRIEDARGSLGRSIADIELAEQGLQSAKPADLEAVLAAIEKRCSAQLRAFLVHANKELAKRVETLSLALEAHIESRASVLSVHPADSLRSGQGVKQGNQLFGIDPRYVEELTNLVSASNAGSKLPSTLPTIADDLCAQIDTFWKGRLRDQVLWAMLRPARLAEKEDEEPWVSIEGEMFYPPMSSPMTRELVAAHLGKEKMAEAIEELGLEFEIPRPMRLWDPLLRAMDAWRFIMQRASGIFAMLMFAGISVVAMIKGLTQGDGDPSGEGNSLLFFGGFVAVLVVVSAVLLSISRNEALTLAERKAKDALIKLQRKALADFAAEWFQAFGVNASASLSDLMRRLRSDLGLPLGRRLADWERQAAGLRERREGLRRASDCLLGTKREITEAAKAFQARSVSLSKKVLKAVGFRE